MSRAPSPQLVLALQAGLVSQELLGQDPFEPVTILRIGNRSGRENCDRVDSLPQQELSFKDLATDFLLVHRAHRARQVGDSNPECQSEDQKRRGAALHRHLDLFLSYLQRARRRGLLASQVHELHAVFSDASLQFVLQGFDQDNVPKVQPEAGFWHVLRCEHGFYGLAAAGSLTIVYPLDCARTRLASDVGSGKKTFNGLFDCFNKTAAGLKGFFSLHAAFGVSLGGIIPYRGFQLGAFDTVMGLNPWKNDTGMITSPPRLRRHRQPSFGRRYQLSLRHCPQASPGAGRKAS